MRLLSTSDPDEIRAIISKYKEEGRAIVNSIYKICWYMRSIGREEALSLSYFERKAVMALIDENIERVNKTRLPIL